MAISRLQLLLLALVAGCSAVIDIDSRTRGIPLTKTNEGNKFCFAFPHNEPQNANDLKYLGIFIGTMEDQPVQYRIVHGDSSVNRMGTVNPGQIVREQYQTHDSLAGYPRLEISPDTTSGAKPINDFVGFVVETVNSSQKIQVAAFSDSFGSADGFCVPPLLNYTFYIPSDSTDVLDTHQYTYTALTSAGERAAMAAIVACDDLSAGAVNVRDLNRRRTSTGTIYFEQSRISFRTTYNPTKALSQHNVAVVPKTGSNEALTGLIFYANKPIGFMVGHECTNIPTTDPVTINCDHAVEQIPPSYTWGYNFFVTPFMRRTAGYDLKIYPRYDNTNYTIHCTLGDGTVTYNNREVTGLQRDEVNVNERTRYNVMTQSYCCIKSDRPVVVMQYSKGHGSDNDNLQPQEDEDLGDPAMVLVAPVGQYLKRQLFSNDIEMFPNDPYRVNAASITVLSQCFHANNITLNGSVLERDASRYTPVHCDDSGNPCGYALNTLISVGTHIIEHLTPDCYLNVIVYGFGKEKGYAFPAGFGMDPIGETFYSIEGIVVSAEEATLGPVTARVYKSGDISQPSSIDVQTFSYSGSNAATFGVDLAAATRTVNFAAGVSHVDVDFNFFDDSNAEMNEIFGVRLATSNPRINIGTPSSVDFTIIDDDFVPVMITFSSDNYIVMENTGYVIVTLNASQSVPSDVLVNVMSSPLSPGVEAMVDSDYMPFNVNLTIPSGQSTVTYNITITNDGVPEPTERFLLNYRVVDTGGATGIDGSGQSSVTILDTDRSVISYDPSSVMSNEEDGYATLKIVMDRPYYKDVIISSFDVQVANTHPLANEMGVDYFNFNRTITIPAGQTSYSFNVTLNNDNILEQREEFGIRLAVLDDSRVDVAPSVATSNVIINDDEVVTVRLTSNDYMVSENTGYVIITLNASQSVPSDVLVNVMSSPLSPGVEAMVDSDYMPFNVNLTIPSGQSTVTYNITITNDGVPEPTERFLLNYRVVDTGGASRIVGSGQSSVTILDTDRSVISYDPSSVMSNEEDGYATLKIVMDRPYYKDVIISSFDVQVANTYSLANDMGVDYFNFSRTITIPAGQTSYSFNVTLNNDNILEQREEFGIRLAVLDDSRVDVAPSVATSNVIINDVDTITVGFTRDLYTFPEPMTASSVVSLPVTISGQSSIDTFAGVSYIDGTATGGGVDYNGSPSTSVAFPAGSGGMAMVQVTLIGDNLDEPNESFRVSMMIPSQFEGRILFSRQNTSVQIQDSDGVQFNINLTASMINVTEGQPVKICVSRTGDTLLDYTLTLQPNQISGGATAGVDFNSSPQTFTFSASDTTVCRMFPTTDDNIALEGNEGFSVTLTSTTTGIIGPTDTATPNIMDNDVSNAFFVSPLYEGTEGEMDEICVNLTLPIARPATITLDRSAGSLENNDISGIPSSVTFTPPSQQQCFRITYTDDTQYEGTEMGILTINTGSSGLGVGTPGSTTLRVYDDEVITVRLTSNDYMVSENTGYVIVTLTASESVPSDVLVNVMSSPLSPTVEAMVDSDYMPFNVNLTIPSGQSTVTYNITITNDGVPEPTERFLLNYRVVDTGGATGIDGSGQSSVTILDSDRSVISYDPSSVMSNEEDGYATLKIVMDRPYYKDVIISSFDVQVANTYSLANDMGVDYFNFSRTITIPAGQTSYSFNVTLNNDNILEQREEFGIRLAVLDDSRVDVAPSVATSNVIINDVDTITVGFTRDLYTFLEPMTASSVVSLPVTISGQSSIDTFAGVSYIDGTATGGGVDYNGSPSTSVVFPAGSGGIAMVQVTLIGDNLDEPNESFRVSMMIPSQFEGRILFSRQNTSVQIQDSDGVQFNINLTASMINVTEGQPVKICVSRTGDTLLDYTLTLQPNQISGGATAGDDFNSSPQTFTFSASDTTVCRMFPTTDDNIALEGNEGFSVTLTSTTTGIIGPTDTATPNIMDNDVSNAFFVSPLYEGTEGEMDEICVNLTLPIARPATITLDRSAGSLENNDISGIPSSVTFTPPSQQQCFRITYTDDTQYEGTEMGTLTINTGSSGLGVGTPGSTTLRVYDDEAITVRLTSNNYMVSENTRYVIVTLTASESVPSDVLVNVMSSPLSPGVEAMVDSDYIPFSENLTIPSGQSTVTYNITITNDGVPEPTERFLLNYRVVDTGGATGIDGSGQSSVTILDSDRSVISYDPSSVMSNEEDGYATLKIVMDRPYYKDVIISSFDVQVNNTYPLANDMGVDYFNFSRTITIPAGQTSYSFNVTLNNDNILEQREEFGIRLAVLDDSRVDVAPSVATSNVIINDVDTITVGFTRDLYTFLEPMTPSTVVSLPVTISGQSSINTFAGVSYIDGTATGGGVDYNGSPSTSVAFPAGSGGIAMVQVTLIGDNLDEPNESFRVSMMIPSQFEGRILFSRQNTSVQIQDSDGVQFNINLTASMINVTEGQPVKICVSRTGDTLLDYTLTLQPSQISGGATAGVDFNSSPQTFTFSASDTTVCRMFPTTDDNIALEGNEGFSVTLTSTTTGIIGPTDTATPNIMDNDVSNAFFVSPLYEGTEGEMDEVCVNLTLPIARPATITLDRSAGSLENDDISGIPSSVTFTPPSQQQCFRINYVDDSLVEGTEMGTLTINTGSSGLGVGTPGNTTLRVNDSDRATLEFQSMTYTFDENTGVGEVCVTSTKPIDADVRIRFTTDSNSPPANATAGRDYTSVNETKTLVKGATRLCFDVPILRDSEEETTELFYGRFEVTNEDEIKNMVGDRVMIRNADPASIYIEDVRLCRISVADVIILFDESSSIFSQGPLIDPSTGERGKGQFAFAQDFASDIIKNLPVSSDGTHVGIIRFSTSARTNVVAMLGANNTQELLNIVDGLNEDNRGQETHHKDAFNLAFAEFDARGRKDVPKTIILITDGNPEAPAGNNQSAIGVATEARENRSINIFAVGVFTDQAESVKGVQELNAITGDPSKVFIRRDFESLNNTLVQNLLTRVCPPADKVCKLQSPLKLTTFSSSFMYNFEAICEHVLAMPCNDTSYAVVADFLSQDISKGRVGLQVPEGHVIIDEQLNVISSNPQPSSITVSTEELESQVTKVTLTLASEEVSVERNATDVTVTVPTSKELCGLCGRLNGSLISSTGVPLNNVEVPMQVQEFTTSWRRSPNQRILREDTSECDCSTSLLDMMILFDESSSIFSQGPLIDPSTGERGKGQFAFAQDFASDIIRSLPVSSDGTHIGIIRFSTSARTNVVAMLGTKNTQELLNIVDGLDEDNRGQETHHKDAFNLAFDEFDARGRKDVPKTIILITDGNPEPNDTQSAIGVASDARENRGISIYAVGVFIDLAESVKGIRELNAITGDSSRVFIRATFNELNATLTQQIRDDICTRNITATGDDVSVRENEGPVEVCVKLNSIVTETTQFTFTPKSKPTASDPAEPNDYGPNPQTVTVQPGAVEACVNVSITRDNRDENDEEFCVDVTSNSSAINFQPSNCTITVKIIEVRQCASFFADIVVVVDESSSIRSDQFVDIGRIIEDFSRNSTLGPDATFSGMVRFSTAARTVVDVRLNEFTNSDLLADRIKTIFDTVVRQSRGTETHHLDALNLAVQELNTNGRPAARDIIIFITDGIPNPASQSAIDRSREVRRDNVTILGIFIDFGDIERGRQEIEALSDRAFTVDNLDQFAIVLDNVLQEECRAVRVTFETEDEVVRENDGRVEVCLIKSGQSSEDVVLNIFSKQFVSPPSDVNVATAGQDFPLEIIRNLVFPRAQQRICVYFNVTDDTITEPDEKFQVMFNISSRSDVAFTDRPTANITIIDDDVTASFVRRTYEGDEGTVTQICVELSGASSTAVTIPISISDPMPPLRPAGSGDYSGVPSSVTFPPNVTRQCFNVQFTSDQSYEMKEDFVLTLNLAGTGVNPGQNISTAVTIRDKNEVTIVGKSMNIVIREDDNPGEACIMLTGTSTTRLEVPINITFTPGLKPSAVDPAELSDFVRDPQTVTINPGETQACVDVRALRDTLEENDEDFCLELTSPNADVMFQPASCQVMVTIQDVRRCVTYFSDVLIVADESTSILSPDIVKMREFMKQLVDTYRLSSVETGMGLIRFSTLDRTDVLIPLNSITDKEEFKTKIDNEFVLSNRGAATNHLDAMELAVEEFKMNGRPDAADVIIFITDGEPSDMQSAVHYARAIRMNGTSIYGIFVGNPNTVAGMEGIMEVEQISNPGSSFTIDNFNALSNLTENLIRVNCTRVEVRFITENVRVHEDAGYVQVCLRKEGSTFEDVVLNIKNREVLPHGYGLARAGEDFPLENQTGVVFPRDETIKCFNFTILDDDVGEPNERFQIMFEITSNSNYSYTDRPIANVTILDNNDKVKLRFTSMDYIVNETDRIVIVCIEKTKRLDIDLNLDITGAEHVPRLFFRQAFDGQDFIGRTYMNVVFPANELQICVNFTIIDDNNKEFREEFPVTAVVRNRPSFVEGPDPSKVTILDDDQVSGVDPVIDTANYTVPENNGSVVICVDRIGTIVVDTSITFMPQNGTGPDRAESPGDFNAMTRVAPLNVGQDVSCIMIPINEDNIVEKDEPFSVNINVPAHLPSMLRANVIITDNDTSVLEFETATYTFRENVGSGSICVRARNPIGADVRIRFTTNSNSPANATAGSDYTSVNETKTLAKGATRLCFDVPILRDTEEETTELFYGRFEVLNEDEIRDCFGDRVMIRNADPASIYIEDVRDCRISVADVIILFDESSSILSQGSVIDQTTGERGKGQFTFAQEFASDIIRNLPVSSDGTHIGIIRFSTLARTNVVAMLGTKNTQELLNIVDGLDEDNRGQQTHHKDAFNLSFAEFDARGRKDVPKTIILITDGNPQPKNQSAIGVAADARENRSINIFAVGIFIDQSNLVDGRQELNAITGDPNKVFIRTNFESLNNTLVQSILTGVCEPPPETNKSVCILQSPLRVTPFHIINPRSTYNFRGICEHVFATPCNDTSYAVVGDFLSADLSMGRVGLQVPEGYVIIDEQLNVISSNPQPSSITVSTETLESQVTKVTLTLASEDVTVERDAGSVRIIVSPGKTLCGLCGRINGSLISSTGVRFNDVLNQTKANEFADSWKRAANMQILREDRAECAVLKNDTVIGDPLFEAALWVGEETCKYSLCYEIHGESGKHFNLVSDMCVSVNALYTAMRNPADGNIISAIGIRGSDDTDACHNIEIVQNQVTGMCDTRINGGSVLAIGSDVTMNGINVRQRMMSRVRVSLPNCERIPLVMWVTCQNMSGELMIKFDITRGVNLRPSSHGLLGQFYNIKLQAMKFTDQTVISTLDPEYYAVDQLWVISVSPPPRAGLALPTRRFVGELYDRAWDMSQAECLYAGNSQGGGAIDYGNQHSDSVIEGHYRDYIVSNIFATNFKYEMFDESRC